MKDFEGRTFIYNGPVKVSKTQLQNEISSLRVVKSVYGEKYQGCYAENSKDRDLGTKLVSYKEGLKEPFADYCFRLARDKGFKFAALSDGKECYGGNSYGKHSKKAAAE